MALYSLSTAEKVFKFWTVQKRVVIGAETLSKRQLIGRIVLLLSLGDGAGGVSLGNERKHVTSLWKVSIRMALGQCLTYGQKTALASPFSDQEKQFLLFENGWTSSF